MSLVLLDTTFLVEAERSAQILETVIGDDDDVAIAAITVAELLVGVKLASTKWRDRRRDYVDDILSSIPVIAYDTTVAVQHAELLAAVRATGRPRGAHELIIAATARATGRTVVSADTTAFSDLPSVDVKTHRQG